MGVSVLQNYNVSFSSYSVRHYEKSFAKKYKTHWTHTKVAITETARHIDMMLQYQRADLIKAEGDLKLVKLDFAVAGTKISPKSSGNRAILVINERLHYVDILMLYHKNDVVGNNETAWWIGVVRDNFPEYAAELKLVV